MQRNSRSRINLQRLVISPTDNFENTLLITEELQEELCVSNPLEGRERVFSIKNALWLSCTNWLKKLTNIAMLVVVYTKIKLNML